MDNGDCILKSLPWCMYTILLLGKPHINKYNESFVWLALNTKRLLLHKYNVGLYINCFI